VRTSSLAFRNLFRNFRRTLLTVLLIGFSLAALILFDGIMRGMITLMVENITGTLSGEAQVHAPGYRENFDVDLILEDRESIERLLQEDATVQAYAPRAISGAMISSSYNVTSGLLYGIDAEREIQISKVRDAVIEGDFLTGGQSELLMGSEMAELLEVGLGDRIVLTLSEVETGELAQALFRVTGIIQFGLRELDESFIFINIDAARQVLAMNPESAHEYVITFVTPLDLENPQHPVLDRLNETGVEALNWLDLNPEISMFIGFSQYSSLIIGGVLFLLASLGVINSMFMSIYERIYEFGVIKAIGTRPGEIRLMIMIEALFIALLSCAFGLLLGGAIGYYTSSYGIYIGEMEFSGVAINNNIMTEFHIMQFTQFPLYVVLLTVIAAIYPALFAARIVPSQALQRSL